MKKIALLYVLLMTGILLTASPVWAQSILDDLGSGKKTEKKSNPDDISESMDETAFGVPEIPKLPIKPKCSECAKELQAAQEALTKYKEAYSDYYWMWNEVNLRRMENLNKAEEISKLVEKHHKVEAEMREQEKKFKKGNASELFDEKSYQRDMENIRDLIRKLQKEVEEGQDQLNNKLRKKLADKSRTLDRAKAEMDKAIAAYKDCEATKCKTGTGGTHAQTPGDGGGATSGVGNPSSDETVPPLVCKKCKDYHEKAEIAAAALKEKRKKYEELRDKIAAARKRYEDIIADKNLPVAELVKASKETKELKPKVIDAARNLENAYKDFQKAKADLEDCEKKCKAGEPIKPVPPAQPSKPKKHGKKPETSHSMAPDKEEEASPFGGLKNFLPGVSIGVGVGTTRHHRSGEGVHHPAPVPAHPYNRE